VSKSDLQRIQCHSTSVGSVRRESLAGGRRTDRSPTGRAGSLKILPLCIGLPTAGESPALAHVLMRRRAKPCPSAPAQRKNRPKHLSGIPFVPSSTTTSPSPASATPSLAVRRRRKDSGRPPAVRWIMRLLPESFFRSPGGIRQPGFRIRRGAPVCSY